MENFEFWFLEKILHLKMSKVPKNSKFSAAQMVKMAVQNDQNWLHLKSEWLKNPESSRLYIPN